MHFFEARHEVLDLLDDVRKLCADAAHVVHALFHLGGKFLHAHDAGRYRRLHFLDHLFDVPGGDRGLIGQTADLGGDHGEADAVFTGLFRLDGGVQRQQIGLVRDLIDGGDHGVDVAGLLGQHREL